MWPACLPPILGQKRGKGCSPQQVTGPGETEARVPLPHFCPPPAPHWPSSHRLGESEAQMAELDPWPGDAPAMLSPCPHILSRCQHAPGKVGCTGWVLSPPGVRGGCCDPLRGWGCGHLGSPPSPQVPPGATPGQRARLGGSASAAETSLGPFPQGGQLGGAQTGGSTQLCSHPVPKNRPSLSQAPSGSMPMSQTCFLCVRSGTLASRRVPATSPGAFFPVSLSCPES